MPDAERLGALANVAAVVGVGDTDYVKDYASSRSGKVGTDAYGYAAIAFRAAIADSGLQKSDIDGLVAGPATASERLGEVLGIDVQWASQADAANAVIQAVTAIHAGLASCVALVYGNDQRSAGTAYGGANAMGGERFLAYVHYAPWGLTSQGGLYALMASRYMEMTGFRSEDLAQIVIAQRQFASLNPNAIMRKPLDLDEYLSSRFICEPLRLYDYCLINDGGVAMIVTTAERARAMNKPAVGIAGLAKSDMNRGATSLQPRLLDFYHPAHKQAADRVFNMASVGPGEIDLVQIYDSFSVHVPFALEGFGYAQPGEVPGLLERGTGPGGKLPINSSGGMLSESYMQGWNHQVEAVRQIRGEAGGRQIAGARTAHYISDVAGKVATLIYKAL